MAVYHRYQGLLYITCVYWHAITCRLTQNIHCLQRKPVKKRTTNTSQRTPASDVEVPCSKDKEALENLDSSIAQAIASVCIKCIMFVCLAW